MGADIPKPIPDRLCLSGSARDPLRSRSPQDTPNPHSESPSLPRGLEPAGGSSVVQPACRLGASHDAPYYNNERLLQAAPLPSCTPPSHPLLWCSRQDPPERCRASPRLGTAQCHGWLAQPWPRLGKPAVALSAYGWLSRWLQGKGDGSPVSEPKVQLDDPKSKDILCLKDGKMPVCSAAFRPYLALVGYGLKPGLQTVPALFIRPKQVAAKAPVAISADTRARPPRGHPPS